jgi:hypothetical protein
MDFIIKNDLRDSKTCVFRYLYNALKISLLHIRKEMIIGFDEKGIKKENIKYAPNCTK